MAVHLSEARGSLQRREMVAAGAQFGAIVVLFLIAFFGRDYYGDVVRSILVVLSATAGAVAVAGGLITFQRAIRYQPSRLVRFVLAASLLFVGGYTIIHVLVS